MECSESRILQANFKRLLMMIHGALIQIPHQYRHPAGMH